VVVARMPQERFPVVWLGGAAVLTLPDEIDISNAGKVRDDLLWVLNRGPTALVVDMGGTTFCDSAGVNALVRAHRRAEASGSQMRLVVSSPGVGRVLAITGVDQLIPVYPSVAASLAGIDRPGRGEEAGPPPARQDGAPAEPGDWAPQPG
jgi:anti-sigma B factor antagonist